MRSVPCPASISSASIFMPRTRLSPLDASVSTNTSRIGKNEIRRRKRVGDLLDVEFGLLAGVRVEPFGVMHQVLRPLRCEQIELHHEIEKLVRFPYRGAES